MAEISCEYFTVGPGLPDAMSEYQVKLQIAHALFHPEALYEAYQSS